MKKIIEQIVKMRLWEEEFRGFEFTDENTGWHSGQTDYVARMFDKERNLLAFAIYTIFQEKVYIQNIESKVKGKGYGTTLMEWLASKYGYENMERTSLTPDGAKMRSRLDKIFDFDYEESQNKHYKPELIDKFRKIDPKLGEFMDLIYKNGRSKGWEMWLDKYERQGEVAGWDLNDIDKIVQYIRGSKEEVAVDDEPTHWVSDIVDNLDGVQNISESIRKKVDCQKCNWNWKIERSDKNPFLCHKCGYDNKKGEYDMSSFHKWKLLNRPV